MILAHGFLMDHEMFVHHVAALRDDHRVITWDERGFGATEYDGKPFSYWDSANAAWHCSITSVSVAPSWVG